MTAIRTIAFGTVTAALVAGLVWAPRPAAGQQPPATPATVTAPAVPEPPFPGAPDSPAVYAVQGLTPNPVSVGSRTQTQISQLARQYVKSVKEDEKKDIRKKLSEALAKQFDQLAERQQKELQDLEKQVEDLKTLLKKRRDNRDAIIERRLEQVVQDAEGLGWSTPSSAPRAPGALGGGFGGFGGTGR